jgi:hypothetical protein
VGIDMAWLEDFDCEMITNVKITSIGEITNFDSAGQPIYGSAVVKYNDGAAVWQLSSSEVLANDKINNPSTHSVVLDPAKVTGTLTDQDTCEITINGKAEQFKMYTPDNIMGLGDMVQFTAIRKVVS